MTASEPEFVESLSSQSSRSSSSESEDEGVELALVAEWVVVGEAEAEECAELVIWASEEDEIVDGMLDEDTAGKEDELVEGTGDEDTADREDELVESTVDEDTVAEVFSPSTEELEVEDVGGVVDDPLLAVLALVTTEPYAGGESPV